MNAARVIGRVARLKIEEQLGRDAEYLYRQHPRARFVALDDETKGYLACLYEGARLQCPRMARQGFHQVLEQLTDEFELNILRPAKKELPKMPEPIKGPDGQPLPNPWRDANGQYHEDPQNPDQRAIIVSNPALAEHYRRLARDPHQYMLERSQEENRITEENAREARYFSTVDHQSRNPFCATNRTAQVDLWKADPEYGAVCKREAEPMRVPFFGHNLHATTRNKIFNRDRVLHMVIESAQEMHKTLEVARFEQAEIERRADAIEEAKKQRERDEWTKGVTRTADGRVITMGR